MDFHSNNGESFSSRLRRLRVRKGFSASDVARRVGVAISTYRDWENGRAIKGQPYGKMAEVLGVSLSELLVGGKGKNSILEDLSELERIVRRIRQKL